jgi:diguanylate cyclase (GGDEF)-like protein
MIKSDAPHRYLMLYLGLELIAFSAVSFYAAFGVAVAATFSAIAVLVISGDWTSVIAVGSYWGAAAIINSYLNDLDEEYGKRKLKIENKEKEIARLGSMTQEYEDHVPVLKQWVRRYILMSEFSLKLSTSFEVKQLYSFVLEYVRKFFPDRNARFMTPQNDEYDKWVREYKKPLLVEDANKDYRFAKDKPQGFRSLIESPLFQGGKVTGAIRVESKKERFTHSDLRLLGISSTLASIAVDRGELFSRTQELAVTDALTGLYTHTYFLERLEEEIRRAARYNENFALLMMDIDEFKKFNDTYGHQAGDRVLEKVAAAIRGIVRETDIVGRYGGEEISVVLHNIDFNGARQIAQRLRESIGSLKFDRSGEKISITIGASFFPKSPTAEQLIRRADQALYAGKEKGKNRVEFYDRG